MKKRYYFLLLSLVLDGLLTQNLNAQIIMGRQRVDTLPISDFSHKTFALTWLPASYNTSTRDYPLIVFLHGSGETGSTVANLSKLYASSAQNLPYRIASGWDPVAVNPTTGALDSFIVVSPQAPSWSYGFSQLKTMLPAILAKYRVDTTRIYLTGLSAGGNGLYTTLGSNYEPILNKITAVAIANGAGADAANGYTDIQVENNLSLITTEYNISLWTVASENDQFLNTNVKYHNISNSLNPISRNKLTVVSNVAHSVWVQMYNPDFRPAVNYYGNNGSCQNNCINGGIPVTPNTNGSPTMGSGINQDSLSIYEWLLTKQKTNEVTGISQELKTKDELKVYPIPTSENFNVILPNNQQMKQAYLENILGQFIFNWDSIYSENGIVVLNTNDVKEGVYILSVVGIDNIIYKQLIEIRHP
jgi:hypothetical protein